MGLEEHVSPSTGPDHHDDQQSQPETDTINSAEAPYSVFSKRKRVFIIIMTTLCAIISPLSANIYFPALNVLSAELHVSSSLINVSLTTFMIFQGLAPVFLGDLADTAGRRPAYIIGFVFYIGACIGLALQTSFPALLILRCLQACGSSSTIALASGVAADVSTSQERGTYMGWVNGGALLGPSIGPVLGGVLAQFLGWRSIFWFLAILAGVILIPLVLVFPETGRNVVGNGSIPPQRWNRDLLTVIRDRGKNKSQDTERQPSLRQLRFPNPLSTLRILKEKDVGLLLLFNCLVYCAFYSVTTSLPFLFAEIYNFNALQIGLSFIPYGVGSLLAAVLNGHMLDWRFRQVANSLGIKIVKDKTIDLRYFPLERVRFPLALVLILIGNTALLCYGWVLHVQAPLAVPLVLLFFIGYFITGSFNCCSVALIDYYPNSPATVTACNNLCRCLLGAGNTAVIILMINSMGRGWCFTFIALVIYATTPILWVLMRWGPAWREERAQKIDAKNIIQAENSDESKEKAG
ncbi:major facilitator superfamily domain-containing protein [Rhodocollybia butyracea]|uniref:Major facilitator superfamily domain-containing protein n=1 Tax=Rhodocollybia butyracea TaxID=206335 RepID=A0A9P5PU58_9AGAR|nr:major facilitator superfamily domain-containing protein [Rhodocollybia butyracea]